MVNFENIKNKVKEIFRLALPIATSFVAIGLMGIVDTIIVGHYNTDQLAYMGIANSIFMILFTVPIALLQGVMIKTSQKFGARKFASCGKIYNEGKRYLIGISIIFTIIGLFGKHILYTLGQNDEMAVNGGRILQLLSISIPFILMSVNANFFLQSIKRPHVSMYSAIIANILNIAINPVLVYGMFGMPEMGAMGAATTTVVIRVFIAAFALIYIKKMKENPKLNKRFGLDRKYDTWWSDSASTRRIGYGVVATTIAVNGSFSIANIFAGWMGELTMATFVIINSVGGLLFMLFFALSQSTSIIVANAFGRKDINGIKLSVISGFIILITAMIIFLSLFAMFPNIIFGVFSDDSEVIMVATSLIGYMIFEIVIDSLPLNIVGSLNGCGDVKVPTINQIASFLFVRVIACYIFAFNLDMGLRGLIIGMAFGGIASIILNYFRLTYLVNKKLSFNK